MTIIEKLYVQNASHYGLTMCSLSMFELNNVTLFVYCDWATIWKLLRQILLNFIQALQQTSMLCYLMVLYFGNDSENLPKTHFKDDNQCGSQG